MASIRLRRPGVWEIRVFTGRDDAGRPTQVSKTVRGTKRDAQRVAATLESRPPSNAGGRTVADVLAAWREVNDPVWAETSRRDYARRIARVLEDPIATTNVARLSVADVERWHARLRKAGVGEAAIRGRHATPRAALAQAVRWGWVGVNVASQARLRQSKRAPREAMSPDDVRAVIEAARALDPAAALALRLAAVAGLRRAELAALRWDDLAGACLRVDSSACAVRGDDEPIVIDAPTKTANGRVVQLDQRTVTEIKRLRVQRAQVSPYMFSLATAVLAWLDLTPEHAGLAEEIASAAAGRAVVVGSGRVGRTRLLALEERAALAARATVRHGFTDYDDRLAGLDPFEAEVDDFEYRLIKRSAHDAVDDFLCAHRQPPTRAYPLPNGHSWRVDDAQGTPDVDLDGVMARARELPTWLRSLRVETQGWSEDALSMLASERSRGLLVQHRPARSDAPVRRSEMRVRSWMEFGEDGWDHPGIGVWPERWRQEVEQASSNRDVVRSASGRDRDSYWWDHGQGIKVTDTRNLKTSLTSWWVPGTLWVRAPAQRELVAVAETVLERPTARIRIMPDRAGWAAGPFHSGDEHEIEVDIATGLTLAVTSFVDGASFHHDEVTEFETEPTISPALTAVPAGAERVPATQGFRSVEEIAAATPLSLLAPRWLPPEFMFQTGGVFIRDGVPEANLVYSRDRRVFVSLYEWPESRLPGEETIEWEPIDRGSRTVLMSDQSDRPGKRIARTTLDGTVAFIDADLPAPELLQLAFSLDVVCP